MAETRQLFKPEAPIAFRSRQIHAPGAMDPRLVPKAVKAPHGATVFELTWADGVKHAYPHEILRGFCPCAGCQGHTGAITFQGGHNLELRDIERVGNYALGLRWGDGHDSGIYSFRYLRRLGELLAELGADELRARGELPRETST